LCLKTWDDIKNKSMLCLFVAKTKTYNYIYNNYIRSLDSHYPDTSYGEWKFSTIVSKIKRNHKTRISPSWMKRKSIKERGPYRRSSINFKNTKFALTFLLTRDVSPSLLITGHYSWGGCVICKMNEAKE